MNARKVLITGAASGMGREIARLFAAEGASLALLDRDEAGVATVATDLGAQGYGCDVTDRDSVNRIVAMAGDTLGGIDGVINAAGILDITPFVDLDPASWDKMIAVNLTGPFNIIKAALPYLTAADGATIVNIASVSALMPMPGTAGYSASKAGAAMFTKSIAMDLGPRIRANTICPGVIKTEMTRYLWENPEHTARAAERVALKRLGETSDIAKAALFFSTDDSGFTTGTELPVDGGFSWR
ncbi:SDR family NAD(P)-dependent oxidoreductase [Novosphingobium sp. MMS21-SN21R]|uniref:SDR family NAD(P)-dependent oxidoreductase n=1 Tax=Novosphingobium sp. MMS21-SN21R TaxID=2969298 RepID=UPI0028837F84|nr:SDR family NAD(P)-dependent oxidoreductase [Novosphingobium sp. MMS21-SN21R]MDT0509819.1 SDR family NAD(P)-dependent oxidoreductase [Novosphingobium sp. MMS21-SN21R]